MTVDSPISIKSVQVIWSRATTKQTNKQIALKSSTAIRKTNGKQLFLSQSPFFISKLDIYLEKKLTKNLTECLNIATYWRVIAHLLALLNSKKKSHKSSGAPKRFAENQSLSPIEMRIYFFWCSIEISQFLAHIYSYATIVLYTKHSKVYTHTVLQRCFCLWWPQICQIGHNYSGGILATIYFASNVQSHKSISQSII